MTVVEVVFWIAVLYGIYFIFEKFLYIVMELMPYKINWEELRLDAETLVIDAESCTFSIEGAIRELVWKNRTSGKPCFEKIIIKSVPGTEKAMISERLSREYAGIITLQFPEEGISLN